MFSASQTEATGSRWFFPFFLLFSFFVLFCFVGLLICFCVLNGIKTYQEYFSKELLHHLNFVIESHM